MRYRKENGQWKEVTPIGATKEEVQELVQEISETKQDLTHKINEMIYPKGTMTLNSFAGRGYLHRIYGLFPIRTESSNIVLNSVKFTDSTGEHNANVADFFIDRPSEHQFVVASQNPRSEIYDVYYNYEMTINVTIS